MLANMAIAKGHSSKTKSHVSSIRTIGPLVECYDFMFLGKKTHEIEGTSRHDHSC